jgi:COMPASS component SWD2
VVASDDNTVNYYDVEKAEKINTYHTKRYGVDLIKFTHHNKCVLCASKQENYNRITYWSLHDNNILCSFVGHEDQITHLDVNPLNSTFVSVSKDGVARVWEYEKKQCLMKVNKS